MIYFEKNMKYFFLFFLFFNIYLILFEWIYIEKNN